MAVMQVRITVDLDVDPEAWRRMYPWAFRSDRPVLDHVAEYYGHRSWDVSFPVKCGAATVRKVCTEEVREA